MAKFVLGNDPFTRGAADRSAEPPAPEPVAAVAEKPARKPRAKKAAPAPGKPEGAAAEREFEQSRAAALRVAEEPADSAHNLDVEPQPLPPVPLGERALGALAIAKDILRHAASSEGMSRVSAALQAVWHAVLSGMGTASGTQVDAFGEDARLVREMQPITDFLYERYWRVSVENADAVPRGQVIIVANHAGVMPVDGPVLQQALLRERPDLERARWLVEDQIFHTPFIGTLLNRMGAVRACPENALRLLAEKRPVLVFPEGIQGISKPFRERYQLKRFGRGGFVKLALRTGAPIVPVAIVGAEETHPLLTKLPGRVFGLPYVPVTPLGPIPLPAKWSIRFGEPLPLKGHGPGAADDPSVVQEVTEATRQAIESMLTALIRDRKSVFGG